MKDKLIVLRDKLEAVAEELEGIYISIQAEEVRESIDLIDDLIELESKVS